MGKLFLLINNLPFSFVHLARPFPRKQDTTKLQPKKRANFEILQYLGGTATGLCIIITPKYDTIGIKWKEVKGLHFYSDFHCGNSTMNLTSTMFPHKIQGAAGSCFSMGQNGGQYWSMMVSDTSHLEPREARHHKPKTRPQPPASTPTGPDPYFVPMLCCP